MDRRTFINYTAFSTIAALLSPSLAKSFTRTVHRNSVETADETICAAKFSLAISERLSKKPIGEVIVDIGKSFVGTEYKANVLETTGAERLIVNMQALDCVTFYENALTLARCIKMRKLTFNDYKAQLQFIRYRGGIINGYPSRLHYTTDYFFDNEKKGVLKIATKELFGEENLRLIPKPINFMSTHRSSYKQLTDDTVFGEIVAQEKEINKRDIYFLPKEKLKTLADKIPGGSILGITTTIQGLDISHTGIAVRTDDGELHLMHAPNIGYKVQISEENLFSYLAKHNQQSGIIVAEALEPTG